MLKTLHKVSSHSSKILARDDGGDVLRYGDLTDHENFWREAIPERSFVILLCENTVPHLGAYIGLHAAGHAILLLPAKISNAHLMQMIETYQAQAVVSVQNGLVRCEQHYVRSEALHPDLSICLSTSGSTGSPKLVRFNDRQLYANAESIAEYLDLTEDEIPLAHLPMEYSFGLSVIHSHMLVGATLLLSNASVMQPQFWENFSEATSLAGVPFHYDMLLRIRLEKRDSKNLRTLVQAGGRLPKDKVLTLHDIASEKGWKFHVMYGQTEAGPRITWLPHSCIPEYPDCIGQPIPGVEVELVNEEMVIKSSSVMMGYAETRADLSEGDVMNGVLYTGDLAEWVDDRFLRIKGRKSRFIKLQGNRVGLQEIEDFFASIDIEVVCKGVDDSLTVFTTSGPKEKISETIIENFSFSPRSFNVVLLDEVPRLSNGKIDYKSLNALGDGGV
ncbi:AMP-binding protein [Palleronia caenipelagi]|uniref:AMP-binding protein n=1 Tax=Palleronia caenipelagi TaxID=2489174 RepID=A0A547PMT1_9RHOB|nr:AMP-binding protein [Palleronia caenipelagi]TRD15436.1 AMP-binding protein [Palleronia caenipelagi]